MDTPCSKIEDDIKTLQGHSEELSSRSSTGGVQRQVEEVVQDFELVKKMISERLVVSAGYTCENELLFSFDLSKCGKCQRM